MRDPRLDKLAGVLVNYSTRVKRGELVTIVSDPAAMPAIEATFEAVLRVGGHPSFHPRSDTLQELILRHGNDEQIRHVSPFEHHRLATCDVLMVLCYQTNTRSLGRISPDKAAMSQASRRELMAMSMQRAARHEMRYVLTEIPSNAAAQDADMSLTDYTDWVFRAGFLHHSDPVASWKSLHAKQDIVRSYLQAKRSIRIQTSPRARDSSGHVHDGTDLIVDVSGGTWINCSGQENFPDGEVFTGPRGADGVVNFTYPAVYRGREVDGVRLKFKAGRVVEASATKNEDYLFSLLNQDDGARNMGEIAIGTNEAIKEFTKNAFFDEKIGGTFHLALGAGYPESGNCNESGLHWDLVSDLRSGGTIHADGELFSQDGRILIDGWHTG
jgi:aminopeptidase